MQTSAGGGGGDSFNSFLMPGSFTLLSLFLKDETTFDQVKLKENARVSLRVILFLLYLSIRC